VTPPRVVDIKRAVAAEFGIAAAVMSEPAPTARVSANTYPHSRPRQLAMALSVLMTRHSQARVGAFFHRDPTTVIHARRAVNARLRHDEEMRERTRNVLRRLRRDP
jgi:chromosomal replication initiator protein